MKYLGFASLTLLLAFGASAQKGKTVPVKKAESPKEIATNLPQEDTRVVFSMNGKDITVSEFLAVFNKNNQSKNKPTEKEIRDYLDLYIKFKYKVADAYNRGLDTSEKFINELAGYRTQLAQPYLNDKETTEALLKEAYDRTKTEVRASHILVRCAENASPKDTAIAYKKIMDLRNRIVKGESFEAVALESSEDPSARDNKGDLGYFSAFKMIYSFEDQCYKAKPNVVSMPFRTEVGYHIILVKDSRPARGEIRVAHIMTMAKKNSPDSIIADAKRRIETINNELKNGASFAAMAKKYSDDASTMDRGGELAPFTSGKMVPEFEEAAFNLKADGDISTIIRTDYGFHIIKRISLTPVPEFEKVKAELQQKINRDARSYKNRDVKIAKIKNEYHFTENPAAIKLAKNAIDSSYFTDKWSKGKLNTNKTMLFSLGTKTVTLADWGTFLDENQLEQKDGQLDAAREMLYKNYVNDQAIGYEDEQLEKKYIDFKNLMREYREGILLFDLSDQLVWGKAVTDTDGLMSFYQAHKMEHLWKERADAQIFQCQSEAIAKSISKSLKKNKKSVELILSEANATNALAVKLTSDKFEKGTQSVLDAVEWTKGLKPVMEKDGSWYVIRINQVIPVGPKELDEIRGLMTTEYQNELEKQWIEGLKKKFNLKVNEDVVRSLY